MRGKLYIVRSHNRAFLRDLIARAPEGYEMVLRAPARTLDQSAKMWAMLTDLANAAPEGRHATPETWKALAMHSCGHKVRFEMGLDGEPFPIGFRSSHLTKAQMADLITFIAEYGDRHGVRWTDEARAA